MAFIAAASTLSHRTVIPVGVSTFTTLPYKMCVPPVRHATLRMVLDEGKNVSHRAKEGAPPQGAPPPPMQGPSEDVAQGASLQGAPQNVTETETGTGTDKESQRFGFIYDLRTRLEGSHKYFRVNYKPYGNSNFYVTTFSEYLNKVRNKLTDMPVHIYKLSSDPYRKKLIPIRNDYDLHREVLDLGHYDMLDLMAAPLRPPPQVNVEIDPYKIRDMRKRFFLYSWCGNVPQSTLKLGDEEIRVRHLQYLLTRIGLMSLEDTDILTGSYGPLTEEAIREFQRRCRMDRITGVYDSKTALWMERVISRLVEEGHKC